MDSAAMDYALQNKATVKFTLHGQNYSASVANRDFERNALVLYVESRSYRIFHTYKGKTIQQIPVHFEISHWYFWRLHCAIQYANKLVLQKLLPHEGRFSYSRPDQVNVSTNTLKRKFLLDTEYQTKALQHILSCKSGAPYLLLGPFGTGKTHILTAAVAKLLENPQNRVLVCTHQNAGADGVYRCLQEHLTQRDIQKVLRIVPDQKGINRTHLLQGYNCQAVHHTCLEDLASWPVVITTFLTALNVRYKEDTEGPHNFTHIIIDEGAQSREPEALAALVLVKSTTKLIIAGDNQQV